jgi:hypothetical protein
VDHLLPEGFLRCNVEGEPLLLRGVGYCKPLQQDPTYCLLDHPQVNIGITLQGDGKRIGCRQGLDRLDVEGDDKGVPTNRIGGHAGVITAVYEVSSRDDKLR